MKYGDGQPKAAYTWDFDGACKPGATRWKFDTFSVGIFQWIPAQKGGVKRGKAIMRIDGKTAQPEEVYNRASDIVRKMNEEATK